MTDDDPVDLVQVGADDHALEGVRSGREASDPVLLMLRDLLDDVSEAEVPVPIGCGSTVLSLAGDRSPDRRAVRKGALVAALTAGLLSVSGAAAATTLAPPGSTLHDVGQVVRSVVGAAVGSVTPPDPVAPAPARTAPAAEDGSARPGAEVSGAARSAAAARQVAALLDAAAVLLSQGRTDAASARLDAAEAALADVAPADAAALSGRLRDLRAQVAAAGAAPPARPAQQPADKPAATEPKQKQQKQQKQPQQKQKQQKQQKQQPAGKADAPAKAQAPAREEPPAESEAPKKEQPAPERKPAGRTTGTVGTTAPVAPPVGDVRGQLSSDASTKPRA